MSVNLWKQIGMGGDILNVYLVFYYSFKQTRCFVFVIYRFGKPSKQISCSPGTQRNTLNERNNKRYVFQKYSSIYLLLPTADL